MNKKEFLVTLNKVGKVIDKYDVRKCIIQDFMDIGFKIRPNGYKNVFKSNEIDTILSYDKANVIIIIREDCVSIVNPILLKSGEIEMTRFKLEFDILEHVQKYLESVLIKMKEK